MSNMNKKALCCCNCGPSCDCGCQTSSCSCCCSPCGGGPFLGRLLLSFIFLAGAVGKIFGFTQSVEMLKQLGIGGEAVFYVFLAIALELVGALMVLLGWRAKIGSLLLMIFMLPTTLIFHNFWSYEGAEAANQSAHFLKNLAIYGGLVLLVCYGPGPWSIDACRKKRVK